MKRKKNYRVVNDVQGFNEIFEYLESLEHEFVAVDIETDSKEEHLAQVIGIAVTGYVDEGIYASFGNYNSVTKKIDWFVSKDEIAEFMTKLSATLLKRKLIMHNGIFDIIVILKQFGIDLTPAFFADTILMKHTVDEERPFGLKDIALLYQQQIGIPQEDIANQEQLDLAASVKRNGGRWTSTDKEIYKGDYRIIGNYACADVDLTLRLFEYFDYELEDQGLVEFFYEKEVMPLCREVTIPMKIHGVYVDVEYFRNLEKELERDILKMSEEIYSEIAEVAKPRVKQIIDKKVKVSKSGGFGLKLLEYYALVPPVNTRTGKPTLAKAALKKLASEFSGHPALNWLTYEPIMASPLEWTEEYAYEQVNPDGTVSKIHVPAGWKKTKPVRVHEIDPGEPTLPEEVIDEIKLQIFKEANPDLPYVININSNKDLAWLLFEGYGCEPTDYSRKTGAPKVDADSLKNYDHIPFISTLLEQKKLEKLLSTYVKPILEKQHEGRLYPSFLAFGTTSGRYSCGGGLNLQTLPRDDKRIKRGFVAPPGYKIVNADFSALEPRIFSWVTGDPGLKLVWQRGLDLYSQVAIDVFGLEGVSADPKADNYLKNVNPNARQQAKVFVLAVVYGASPFRIAQLMDIEVEQAKEIIDNYLDAYPALRKYMRDCELQTCKRGYVRTTFGRIRHLPTAKNLWSKYGTRLHDKRYMTQTLGEFGAETYYRFRNLINNARNFPIQSTAAHVTNASMIKLSRLFKKHNIDGSIVLNVHDEISCIVREDQAEFVAELLKDAMENNPITEQIDIPIIAEPLIADNLADAK